VTDREPYVTVAEAIDDLPDPYDDDGVPNHVAVNHRESTVEKLKQTKRGESPHPAYARAHPDQPAFTVVAGKSAAPVHHDEARRCTPRETARFQSFDDSYVFTSSSKTRNYQLIGNAVPPKLAESLANTIPV